MKQRCVGNDGDRCSTLYDQMHLGGGRQWLQDIKNPAHHIPDFHHIIGQGFGAGVQPENIKVAVDQGQQALRFPVDRFRRLLAIG